MKCAAFSPDKKDAILKSIEANIEAIDGAEVRRPSARPQRNLAIEAFYAELRERHPGLRLEIRTVRPAMDDEIEFCCWNEEMLAREQMGRRMQLRRP